jgi:hypothetical protein
MQCGLRARQVAPRKESAFAPPPPTHTHHTTPGTHHGHVSVMYGTEVGEVQLPDTRDLVILSNWEILLGVGSGKWAVGSAACACSPSRQRQLPPPPPPRPGVPVRHLARPSSTPG